MKIEPNDDHLMIRIPYLSWRELRAIIDWLDETKIETNVALQEGVDLHRLYPEPRAYIVTVHLYSEEDAVLFKLKWAGAVGKPSPR